MSQNPTLIIDYKAKYRALKRKFAFLVYENECYQEELRNLQRKLLKLSRDKNFLLDRMLQYENLNESSDDTDATLNSDDEATTSTQKPGGSKSKNSRAANSRRKRTDKVVSSLPQPNTSSDNAIVTQGNFESTVHKEGTRTAHSLLPLSGPSHPAPSGQFGACPSPPKSLGSCNLQEHPVPHISSMPMEQGLVCSVVKVTKQPIRGQPMSTEQPNDPSSMTSPKLCPRTKAGS